MKRIPSDLTADGWRAYQDPEFEGSAILVHDIPRTTDIVAVVVNDQSRAGWLVLRLPADMEFTLLTEVDGEVLYPLLDTDGPASFDDAIEYAGSLL